MTPLGRVDPSGDQRFQTGSNFSCGYRPPHAYCHVSSKGSRRDLAACGAVDLPLAIRLTFHIMICIAEGKCKEVYTSCTSL